MMAEHSQRLDFYRKATQRIADNLDAIRRDITEWIERNDSVPPDLRQIALLEAFHADRARLAAELLVVEQNFMDHLLAVYKKIAGG